MADIRPFSNGSQHYDWRGRNCDRCIKYNDDIKKSCELDVAISRAAISDGKLTPVVARRIGYYEHNGKDGFSYTWDCPERVS